jgi:uncharacterized protein (TIGR03083 family)
VSGDLSAAGVLDVASITPIGHSEAAALGSTEFGRVVELLRSLDAADWTRPTECELWDVRAMAGHILGMAEIQASVRQFIHDFRAGSSRDCGAWIDAVTSTQVRERAGLTTDELVNRLTSVAPRAVAARRRVPRPLRWAVRFRQGAFDGERWTLGYVFDVISNRDLWMHRLDICRATGHPFVETVEHDGRILADVVADWARRHGQPFALTLTGPAGGRWRTGTDGEHLELEALEFCRTVSGREPGAGLLDTPVPF